MNKQNFSNISIPDMSAVVKEEAKKINVTIHVPDHLHERVRNQKINRIYDILNPDVSC